MFNTIKHRQVTRLDNIRIGLQLINGVLNILTM